jgi:hypothetical protein
MWLTGRLAPDHKTIADFRKDNGPAIRKVCVQLVALCREMGLLTAASVAIDGMPVRWKSSLVLSTSPSAGGRPLPAETHATPRTA